MDTDNTVEDTVEDGVIERGKKKNGWQKFSWKKAATVIFIFLAVFSAGIYKHASSRGETENTQTSSPVAAPDINKQETEEISVDKAVSEKLEKAGKRAQDSWFMEQMRKTGTTESEGKLISLRTTVCSELSKGANVDDIIEIIGKDLTSKQQGVMIAASMISRCPENKIEVRSRDLKNNHNPQLEPAENKNGKDSPNE